MGKTLSIDSSYGEITLNNVKTAYHTGTQITGEVFVRLHKNFPSNTLHLVLKGQEKVKLPHNTHHNHNHNNHNHHHHHGKTYVKDKEEIYYQTFPLVYNGVHFPAGCHTFPFTINLPVDMPPSFEYKMHSFGEKYYAKVKYKLSAVLQTHCKSAAICDEKKLEIIPSPNPAEMKTYNNLEMDMNKNDFNFKCKIDKFYVTRGTVINAWMGMDNSKSSYDIKKLKWKTVMYTNLNAKHISKEVRTRIDKTYLGGVLAGHKHQENLQIVFNGPSDENFRNAFSYNGKLIQNRFVLEFAAVTPTFVFFSKDNKLEFNLIVAGNSPMQHPHSHHGQGQGIPGMNPGMPVNLPPNMNPNMPPMNPMNPNMNNPNMKPNMPPNMNPMNPNMNPNMKPGMPPMNPNMNNPNMNPNMNNPGMPPMNPNMGPGMNQNMQNPNMNPQMNPNMIPYMNQQNPQNNQNSQKQEGFNKSEEDNNYYPSFD